MKTQAQVKTIDYVCYATWVGSDDDVPIEPDASYLFIDTTSVSPPVQGGDVYDPATGTWSTP